MIVKSWRFEVLRRDRGTCDGGVGEVTGAVTSSKMRLQALLLALLCVQCSRLVTDNAIAESEVNSICFNSFKMGEINRIEQQC